MIIAELQGKIPSKLEDKEDILTSNIFSFFKYSDRRLFKEYLGELGLSITLQEAKDAEFIFWLRYDDGTEPDLVVSCDRYYILFEAKLYSDFAPKTSSTDSQIEREISMGKMASNNDNKDFIYVAITAEYFKENRKYAKYENKDFHFIWTNWQSVANFLESKLKDINVENGTGFANDLFNLLVKKRLRSYNGLTNLNSNYNYPRMEGVFYNLTSSKYKGEYSGFVEILANHPNIDTYQKFYGKIFFENLSIENVNPTKKIFYNGD